MCSAPHSTQANSCSCRNRLLTNSTLTGQCWVLTSMNLPLMFTFKYIYKQSTFIFLSHSSSGVGRREAAVNLLIPIHYWDSLFPVHILQHKLECRVYHGHFCRQPMSRAQTLLCYVHQNINTQTGTFAL